ncbi:LAQU0S14e02278g1_1 [Lachancea quebecensis]|uniref:LAQU0S14e02278g1_1 n=1 Tax=Lachancea quebecensis TaxID=1654605 RepID=A0A0P1KW18_9SACH|nr:LAQU0S14e02278g1_1 [Lachancea quebecensis]
MTAVGGDCTCGVISFCVISNHVTVFCVFSSNVICISAPLASPSRSRSRSRISHLASCSRSDGAAVPLHRANPRHARLKRLQRPKLETRNSPLLSPPSRVPHAEANRRPKDFRISQALATDICRGTSLSSRGSSLRHLAAESAFCPLQRPVAKDLQSNQRLTCQPMSKAPPLFNRHCSLCGLSAQHSRTHSTANPARILQFLIVRGSMQSAKRR